MRTISCLMRWAMSLLCGVVLTGCGAGGDNAKAPMADVGVTDASNDAAPVVADTSPDTDPSDIGPDLLSVVDPSTYCESTVDMFCRYYLRCDRMAVDSFDACRATFLEACNSVYEPRYRELVEAGTLELSRRGIESCEAHLDVVSCEQQLFDLDGGCAEMWRGVSPEGAPCGPGIESFVCERGAACVLGLDFCGECRPAAAAGEPCGDGITCEVGFACPDGVCLKRGLPGEGCDEDRPCVIGATCRDNACDGFQIVKLDSPCDRDNRCPYKSECVSGRCVETAMLGEPCGEAGCASGRCDPQGTCAPLSQADASCSSSSECVSGFCSEGACQDGPSACLEP